MFENLKRVSMFMKDIIIVHQRIHVLEKVRVGWVGCRGGSRIFIWGGGGGAQQIMCACAHTSVKPEIPFGRGPGAA